MRALAGRVRRDQIVARTAGLISAQAATSAAGYFYWLLAARYFGARQVGESASLAATSIVVSLIASQALVASLLVRLPRLESQRPAVKSSLLVAAAGGSALGVGVTIGLPYVVPDLAVLHQPVVAASMVVICIAQSVGSVCDAVALAIDRTLVLVWRNGVFGAGKLLLLALLVVVGVSAGPAALLGAWAGAALLTTLWAVQRLVGLTAGGGWSWHLLRKGLGAQNVTSIGGAVPPQLLPMIVTAEAGARLAGWFSLTWLLGGLCFAISPAISQALLPVKPQDLTRSIRKAALLIAVALVVPVVVYLVAGRFVLSFFGPLYARHGWLLLVVLALTAIPDAVTNLGVSYWRIRDDLRPAAWINGVIAVVALGLVVGPLSASRHGLAAVGFSWLIAQSAGCLVLLGLLVRSRHSPHPVPPLAYGHQRLAGR